MLNDLMLLNKFFFAKDLINTNLFATVDFTQGLGVNISSDVKTQFSVFDLGLYLLFFFDPIVAANLRYFILLVYAAVGVALFGYSFGNKQPSRYVLVFSLLFICAPFFLGEISHLSGGMFLAIPMFIYSVRRFMLAATRRNAIYVSITTLILSGVSDLNLILLIPALAMWQLCLDWHVFRRYPVRFLGVYLVAGILVLGNFSEALITQVFATENTISNNLLHSSFSDYRDVFLIPFLKSSIVASIPGPVTLFLNPLLMLMFLAMTLYSKHSFAQRNLLALLLFVLFNVSLGVASVTIEVFKVHVPSYVRYPFGAFPFLMLLSIVAIVERPASLAQVERFLTRVSAGRGFCLLLLFVLILVGVQYRHLRTSGLGSWVWVYVVWLLLPILHLALIEITGSRGQAVVAIAVSLFLPVVSSLLFSYVFHPGYFRILDSNYSKYYLQELPDCIKTFSIGGSYIPVAASPYGPESGRNDGILSLVELPNLYSGRSFFQWRHSYPVVTSEMYGRVTKSWLVAGRGVNYFPPGRSSLDSISWLADYTRSKYIYTIDLPLSSESFRLIGRCRYTGGSAVTKSAKIPDRIRQQLLGEVYLYKRKSSPGLSRVDFEYSKLDVHVINLEGLDQVSVPIAYSPTLVAQSSRGRSINVSRDDHGLVVLKDLRMEEGEIVISSFSWLRVTPFLIMFLVIGAVFVFVRRPKV